MKYQVVVKAQMQDGTIKDKVIGQYDNMTDAVAAKIRAWVMSEDPKETITVKELVA
jgi:hypothetical protein